MTELGFFFACDVPFLNTIRPWEGTAMLETFVPSKIRRALLEYILTHPTGRFYLRGLAKTLGLAVSPLRRELKRLERSGMLTTTPEANILFYTVNIASAAYRELNGMHGLPPAAAVQAPAAVEIPLASAVVIPRSPLPAPLLVGATAAGLAAIFLVTTVSYLSMMNRRLASQARVPAVRKTEVTLVMPPAPAMMMGGPGHSSASGTMHGSRLQVVPGGFGGFSAGSSATQESY